MACRRAGCGDAAPLLRARDAQQHAAPPAEARRALERSSAVKNALCRSRQAAGAGLRNARLPLLLALALHRACSVTSAAGSALIRRRGAPPRAWDSSARGGCALGRCHGQRRRPMAALMPARVADTVAAANRGGFAGCSGRTAAPRLAVGPCAAVRHSHAPRAPQRATRRGALRDADALTSEGCVITSAACREEPQLLARELLH
jgi:hypothetical protein